MQEENPMANQPQAFAGRTILVTGAGAGVGRATTVALSQGGATVIALDRDAAALEKLSGLPDVRILQADLGEVATIGAVVAKACDGLDALHGIANCAAVTGGSPFEAMPPSEWQQVLAVNLTAPALLIQATLPWLRRAAGKAAVVNVASAQALVPAVAGGTAYSASKGGLIGLTKALAAELAPDVRVNVVCPGLIDSDMGRKAMGPQGFDAATQRYLIKRASLPSEVADCIVFLLGDTGAIVTGATWAIDGGRSFH